MPIDPISLSQNEAGFLISLLKGQLNSSRGRLRYYTSPKLGADDKHARDETTLARLTIAFAEELLGKLSAHGYSTAYILEDDSARIEHF